jgi:hypothetical protein
MVGVITIDNGSISNMIPNTTAMVFYDDLGPPDVRSGVAPTAALVHATPWPTPGSKQATNWLAVGGLAWVGPPSPPRGPPPAGHNLRPVFVRGSVL